MKETTKPKGLAKIWREIKRPFWRLLGKFGMKSYAFFSGERQVGATLDAIRKDHIERYQLVADFLSKIPALKNLEGLDIFCGNGYGSYLLSQKLHIKNLLSIDGSDDAVKFAQKHYCSENIQYESKRFPFELPKNRYDFVVSMESIEHVKDDERFLREISSSLKENGLLFLSTPNENKLSLNINPNQFHCRHYEHDKLIEQFRSCNFDIVTFYGQDVYILDQSGAITGRVDEKDMNVKEHYTGQFCIYILRKVRLKNNNANVEEKQTNISRIENG